MNSSMLNVYIYHSHNLQGLFSHTSSPQHDNNRKHIHIIISYQKLNIRHTLSFIPGHLTALPPLYLSRPFTISFNTIQKPKTKLIATFIRLFKEHYSHTQLYY